MTRLIGFFLVASCACVTPPRDDAGVDASITDAGDDDLHVFDVDPPRGWADGGAVTWRLLEFSQFCGPRQGRIHQQINNNGTMLIGCGGNDMTGADDHLVFRDGGMLRTSGLGWTYLLLADDSYWVWNDRERPNYIVHARPDGGVITTLPFKATRAATVSGWLSLEHWGTHTGNPWEMWGPDGGVWFRERPYQYIVKFNEAGVGITSTNQNDAVVAWKKGKTQVLQCHASRGCGATDINESNLIVGERADPDSRATLFWGREYHEASVPVGHRAHFTAVNNGAVAVGNARETDFPVRATGWGFAWARGHTVVLDDLVRDAGYDCVIHTAADINDLNEVVGLATCGDAGLEPIYSSYRLKLGIDP